MTHFGYIFAAYHISGVVLGGMAIWIAFDLRTQKRKLARLEAARGSRRPAEPA